LSIGFHIAWNFTQSGIFATGEDRMTVFVRLPEETMFSGMPADNYQEKIAKLKQQFDLNMSR